MSSINEILAIGKGGMAVSKALLAVAGKNMANVNTPGYSKEYLTLSTSQFAGLGVNVNGPLGIRNPILSDSLRNVLGNQGFFNGQLLPLLSIEPNVNDLDGNGIGKALSEFKSTMQEAMANPGSETHRSAIITAADFLVQSFNSTSKQLTETAEKTREQAEKVALTINTIAQNLAELNSKIAVLAHGKEPPNALLDQREQLLQKLSSLISIDTLDVGDGTVSVFIAGGRPLVDHALASTVTINPPNPAPGTPVGIEIIKPSGQVMNAIGKIGGALGGMLVAHNDVIIPGLTDLDEIAFELTTQFNAIHAGGVGTDGSTGNNFFKALNAVGGSASLIALSDVIKDDPKKFAAAAVGGTLPGDNTNLELLLSMPEQIGVLSSGKSIEDGWFDIQIHFGNALGTAQTGSDIESATVNQLANLLASETAVSIDEELILMNQANQSFDAAGALIRAAEEMSATLINLVG
jgi:flagellar hook-associated protein 1 FlgK